MKAVFLNPITRPLAMLASGLALTIALVPCNALAQAATQTAANSAEKAAASAATLAHMGLSANNALRGAMEKTFDKGQINMLRSVAHQQAVASVCPGFTIDPKRFEAEMNRVYYDAKSKQKVLSRNKLNELEKKAAFGLGLSLGAQLAIAAYDEKAFCDAAGSERANPVGKHVIWTASK
jgi:hypothetical protein